MPTALLSVWDKSGLVPFAKELEKRNWRLVASGGTEQGKHCILPFMPAF